MSKGSSRSLTRVSRLVKAFPIWHWIEVKEITTRSLSALPIHLFYGRMNGREEKKMNASFERGRMFSESPL